MVPNDSPRLVYVFAVRRGKRWSDFIVIPRSALLQMRSRGAGSVKPQPDGKANIAFRIVFRPATDAAPATALCGPDEVVDFQPYRDAWDPWPPPYAQDVSDVPGAFQGADQPIAGDQPAG